jgi:hypothetical protein
LKVGLNEQSQRPEVTLSDEEIEKSIPYPKPVSNHQADQNIGWIDGAKWLRDKLKQ